MAEIIFDVSKYFLFCVIKFFLGILWYSPYLFQNEHLKYSNAKKEEIEKERQNEDIEIRYLKDFVISSLQLYIHYHLIVEFKISNLFESLLLSLMIFVGFIANISYAGCLWENKPKKSFVLDNGLQLFTMVIFSFYVFIY